MRKIARILLLMLLVMPYAHAETLPLAAKLDAHAQFERYPSYKMDEATGEWSAHGLIAGQMVSAVEQGDAAGSMGGGVLVLYPGVRGNRDLSLMEPVLYVCLLRNSPIKADALSIATGGVRYDFVGVAEETKIGERKCERFALPLSQDGLALLRSFANEGGEVRIYGETKVFRTAIHEAEKYKSSKLRVEAMSVQSVRDFLTLWPETFALWDLGAAYWEKDRPKMAAVTLEEGGYAEELPVLEPVTQCLNAQKGAAVKAYQQMLKDKAFFTAKPDAKYGKATRASTKQAQQYYGLLPTGMADRALIEMLNGASQPAATPALPVTSAPLTEDVQAANPCTEYMLEGQLSIRLDRAWAAHSLSPSHSSNALDRVWPTDRSNMLYIADGEIVNLSGGTLQVAMLLQGHVEMGDIRYPLTIQCERNEGRSFGASLLPMGRSRLVIACEVPEGMDLTSALLNIAI
ncbi:MAG: peptidoglycan-binding domain-containing protein, partial [Clostridia bacterium]